MNRSISRPGPLIVYFTFACLTSWTIWFPLYSSAFGIKGLPVLPFHHGIGGLGPLMAAFLTTHLFEGRKGTRRLLAQLFKVRPLAYILVALVSPFLLAAAASAINYLMHQHPIELSGLFSSKEFAGLNFAQFLLYNLFFFGL
ncbi:MAG TPA: hypothetical protein VFS31_10975, partial [Chitinophagaceae bacterium]|nr:hypothetical protein [Chitinophagaceae bacterium]